MIAELNEKSTEEDIFTSVVIPATMFLGMLPRWDRVSPLFSPYLPTLGAQDTVSFVLHDSTMVE
jgi:hypothetical protein